MAYKDDIKASVKTLLELGSELDNVLSLEIDLSVAKNLKLLNRVETEFSTDEALKQLIIYDVCGIFNKRFKEGIYKDQIAGFLTEYQIDSILKDLMVACNRLKVVKV